MSDSGQFRVARNKGNSSIKHHRGIDHEECSFIFSFSLFFSLRGALSVVVIVVSIMRQIYAPFGFSWLFLLSSVDARGCILSNFTLDGRFTRTLEARCKSAFSMLGAI